MPLDYTETAAARERLNTHLGRQPYEPLSADDLRILLRQNAPDQVRLDALTCLGRLREDLDDIERDLIDALRVDEEHDPVSWTRIGRALGMTRQGGEGRYLRLASEGQARGRVVASGRSVRATQAKIEQDMRRRALARWGHYAVAERDWTVRLRARTHTGEEVEVTAKGTAGRLPHLNTWRTGDYRFLGNEEIAQTLQVLQETTPWADVQAPEGLAGLPGDH